MNISTAASLPTTTTAPAPSPVGLKDHLGQLDFSHVLKELDLDGDGQVSDQEFDVYRAAKAARGEFIAADGPSDLKTGRHSASEVTETLFREVMENRQSDS
ncbi:MAG: hypothetical protein COB16_05595 [Rhodobacteraceae bacterium]|nr:MAG: hypothetical protein COB16_05595 [Paracoccaceae bacterium]